MNSGGGGGGSSELPPLNEKKVHCLLCPFCKEKRKEKSFLLKNVKWTRKWRKKRRQKIEVQVSTFNNSSLPSRHWQVVGGRLVGFFRSLALQWGEILCSQCWRCRKRRRRKRWWWWCSADNNAEGVLLLHLHHHTLEKCTHYAQRNYYHNASSLKVGVAVAAAAKSQSVSQRQCFVFFHFKENFLSFAFSLAIWKEE